MQDQNSSSSPNLNVFDLYGRGWEIVKQNLGIFLLMTIITIAINMVSNAFSPTITDPSDLESLFGFGMLGSFGYSLFVSTPITYGVLYAYLKGVRGQEPEIKDMFAGFSKNYFNTVLAAFLMSLIIVVGIFLLIIPGIIFAIRLSMVPFLVVDKEMSATDAISKSWDMTKGYGWNMFGLGLFAIPVAFLGLLALGVGVIVSVMVIYAAVAVYYHRLAGDSGDQGGMQGNEDILDMNTNDDQFFNS